VVSLCDVSTASAPINISNIFTKTSRDSRSSTSDNFYIKASRLESEKTPFQELVLNKGIRCQALRELSKKSFKLRINNKLLSILEDENPFFEVGTFFSLFPFLFLYLFYFSRF